MIHKKNLKREILQSGVIKKTFDLYDDGGCQCYGDCDCYLNQGIKKFGVITYDNKYNTEEEAVRIRKNKIISDLKKKEDQLQSEEWLSKISVKEFNKWVNLFKEKDTQLKRFNHTEIKNNSTHLTIIYRFFLKTTRDTITSKEIK